MYYIYIHKKQSNNNIFYVGKGKGKRAWVKKGRNYYWNNVVNKYGYIVEIIKSNLSEEEAFIQEKFYIDYYKPCCNFTKGGEGISGYKFSIESLRKKSKSALGNKNKLGKTSIGSGLHFKKGLESPFLGRKHNKYSKIKISKSKIGKSLTTQHKLNISKSRSIPIECIETGEKFSNSLIAEKIMNISQRMILEVCKGTRPKAKNFTFKYIKCLD